MSKNFHDALSASPVLKIGAVVLRQSPLLHRGRGLGESDYPQYSGSPSPNLSPSGREEYQYSVNAYDILIIRPKPKTPGEVPPFVLPRGSRQYQDVDGIWHDARDEETGAAHTDRLEPFSRALAREIAEEAGVSSDMLARAQVVELGAMDFSSRTKGNYPIHWFMAAPAPADALMLGQELPEDAMEIKWASLDEVKAMAAAGEFSAGYVPVIEAAFKHVGSLPPPLESRI